MNTVIKSLFDTSALKISPADRPFWYTSGTIGPFYINTHFLFDGEQYANELLYLIDTQKDDKLTCPISVLTALSERYMSGGIYKSLIDQMVMYIAENIDPSDYDFISGGERRDWFFSLILAHFLQKPHITIYKDSSAVVVQKDGTAIPSYILPKGSRVLHIADLITQASSYERAWIPAVAALGGCIGTSLSVVDRRQGGGELLAKHGVKNHCLVSVDEMLFKQALQEKLIDPAQYDMIVEYLENPDACMKRFIEKHPSFITDALNSDDKTRERARICVENHLYGL